MKKEKKINLPHPKDIGINYSNVEATDAEKAKVFQTLRDGMTAEFDALIKNLIGGK